MKIVIVDDELVFAQSFSKMIKEKLSGCLERLDIFVSAERFAASSSKYDLAFLDIEMPGANGLELAKSFENSDLSVVFVTNRDDLVFEAYNSTNAVGFVRKSSLESDLDRIIERLTRENQSTLCLAVKAGATITKIRYSEILYIEKVSHNIVVHTRSADYSMRKTISETEDMLKPYGFVRTHVGYIANLEHVELINAKGVLLSNNVTIPVSRQNIKHVKDEFLKRSVLLNE